MQRKPGGAMKHSELEARVKQGQCQIDSRQSPTGEAICAQVLRVPFFRGESLENHTDMRPVTRK